MNAEALSILDMARSVVGAGLLALGFALIFAGFVGLLRLPDFYTRAHALVLARACGGALVALGLAALAPDAQTALKLALLAGLIAALTPLNAHLLANAAHGAGLAPLSAAEREAKAEARRG